MDNWYNIINDNGEIIDMTTRLWKVRGGHASILENGGMPLSFDINDHL